MNPSHVRTRILEEHEVLRLHLRKLEEAVDAMLVDDAHLVTVSRLARKLLVDLTSHTELEDAILAPALLEIDAWGPVRVGALLEHHERQRQQARELSEVYESTDSPLSIAHLTCALVRDLQEDMQHEEQEILNADLLRDDLVSVAAECG